MDSRKQKLVYKFVYQIDRVSLSDCQNILEMFGYEKSKSPGSHQVYHKKGSNPFTLTPVNGREIKREYKIKLKEFLEQQYPKEFEI
jgi:predicted RNA binding protein YcfA (HicA-like mRNA interferase family)